METIKKWKKDEIKLLLETNDKAVIRGLIRIYERQTEDERKAYNTRYENGIGFNGSDAPILSKLAAFYLKNGYLSLKQLQLVRKKMLKYSGQLAAIANGLQATPSN